MLSYMVPSIEDKPPPAPTKTRFQLDLENPRLTNGHALVNGTDMLVTASERAVRPGSAKTAAAISTESSASSLSSGVAELAPTHHDKPKPNFISNGGAKHHSLKRVSFGSSKGSMVETLIYESPVQEEPEPSSPAPSDSADPNDPAALAQYEAKHPSKVRVTFFEQDRPLVVSSPEPDAHDDLLDAVCAVMTMTASPAEPNGAPYSRQASTDSGWDNPFRPDGDLSREADEIVELIKGGKPITPTPGEPTVTDSVATPAEAAPAPGPRNGRPPGASPVPAPATASKPASPGAVELQRATVAPSDASQVEHVVLKKKPKCKCCVIQ